MATRNLHVSRQAVVMGCKYDTGYWTLDDNGSGQQAGKSSPSCTLHWSTKTHQGINATRWPTTLTSDRPLSSNSKDYWFSFFYKMHQLKDDSGISCWCYRAGAYAVWTALKQGLTSQHPPIYKPNNTSKLLCEMPGWRPDDLDTCWMQAIFNLPVLLLCISINKRKTEASINVCATTWYTMLTW